LQTAVEQHAIGRSGADQFEAHGGCSLAIWGNISGCFGISSFFGF
jgi:hypothetical protein